MKIFELFGEVKLDGVDKVKGQLDGVKGQFKGVGDKMKSVGGGMTKAGGVMVGAVGAIAVPSLKMAADFDAAMRSVNTMLLLNEDDFKKLSDDAREMATTMGIDATEAAGALYQAISAGVPKENVIDFLTVASKAGIAGLADTGSAVSGLATIINAFKLPMSDAQEVSDALFTTVANGVTTFPELAASMSTAMPIAAALGVGYEEVLATVASLTKQGVPTAQAFTQIRATMSALSKPTTEMKDLMEAAGYATGDAMLEALGYQGTLEALTGAADDNKEVLGKAFGSVEALGAVYGVTGDNAEAAVANIEAMSDSTGAADDAFEQMEKSTGRQMAHLMANLKDVAITIGTTLMPVLKDIMDAVMPIIEKIAAWVKENPKLTKTILVIVGAVGGLLLILGPILMVLGTLIPMLPVLGGAFMALMGPVGLIILGIAAVIAIGVLVVKNWDWIKEKAAAIWDGIKNVLGGIGEGIKWVFENMTPIGFIIKNWEEISSMATKIFGGVVDFFKSIPDKIGGAFARLGDIMLAPFRAYVEGLESAVNWIIRQINKISIDIPDWLGGGHIGFNIPTIDLPHFAEGGIVTGPTLAMVGESGPEMILPLSGAGSAGIVNNFNIAEMTVRDDADVKRIARELYDLQQRSARKLGYA